MIQLNGPAQSSQSLIAIEQFDVLGLSGREPAYCPREMNEVRFVGGDQGMHSAFLRQQIALPGVAGAARGDHVGPFVVSAPRERYQMVASQALAMAQIPLPPVTVLAPVAITSKEECVGYLATKAAGHMNELHEADDGRFRKRQSFASDHIARIRFDDLGFPFNYETKGSPERHHCQRLEGGVQRQTPHCAVSWNAMKHGGYKNAQTLSRRSVDAFGIVIHSGLPSKTACLC